MVNPFRADLPSKLDIIYSNLTASIDQLNKQKALKIFTGIQDVLSDHLSKLAHYAKELGQFSYLIGLFSMQKLEAGLEKHHQAWKQKKMHTLTIIIFLW